MEWAIRRAVEDGKISVDCDKDSEIIKRIWNGEEQFDGFGEEKGNARYAD
ncbi:MAG: hypothetical protein L6V93_01135 [Clostridiales bacterium]|nr:MAG: hypothetical protein L6V93_01135 [Clostridiales bacterium]